MLQWEELIFKTMNNVKQLIEEYVKQYCVEIQDNETDEYIKTKLRRHSIIEMYKVKYYIPDWDLEYTVDDDMMRELLMARYKIKEKMKLNNIKGEIKEFLNTFCVKVMENEESSYIELMMDNHDCIEYEGEIYYLPEDCSLMDDEDALLQKMILATFLYE
jgi:hypothetical protein